MNTYGNMLKQLRKEANYIQKDIADKLNICRSLYGRYEAEYELIPIHHLLTLANFYSVSLDYIFEFTNNSTKKDFNPTNEVKAGIRLKTWRKDNKITQDRLAKDLNTNRSVIANYERGRNYIATPFLYSICKKYDVSADYLLGRID